MHAHTDSTTDIVIIAVDADETDPELEQDTAEDDLFSVSDNGGDYDDSYGLSTADAQAEVDERLAHYTSLGRQVVVQHS